MILNEKILITGGVGSLGQELAKQLAPNNTIVIYSRNEERQYLMQQSLGSSNIEYVIGDVRDKSTLTRALYDCTYAIHAAAMKDLIMCEAQPTQTYFNNLEGTRIFLEAVRDSNVQKVIGISTDKSVNPTNVYGATKYIMERMFLTENRYSNKQYFCVRFGNMIDSKGSLISIWKKSLNKEKIKLTHPDVARFFFKTSEAANFIIKCMEYSSGDKIYIPKMKKAKIKKILEIITERKEFEIIGLFPGEKLFEYLFSDFESIHCFKNEFSYFIDRNQTNQNPMEVLHSGNAEEFSIEELTKLVAEC